MGERTIKVALTQTIRMVTVPAVLSFFASLLLWKHIPLVEPYTYASIAVSGLLTILIFQLRFMSHMTVTLWSHLWGSVIPLLAGSLLTLPFDVPLIAYLFVLLAIIVIGIWTAYRLYPLLTDKRLHKSRFARLDEIEPLLARKPVSDGLILGSVKQFYLFRQYICVRPTKQKKEIGNSLIIAPTGGGKGNLIRGQIVAWHDSLIINDPKGDLFLATAGYRSILGDVYVIDPTRGVGHSYDPLHKKATEDTYLSVAGALVCDAKDHEAFWSKSAARMIMQLFKAARIENTPPLIYVRHMIDVGLPAVAERLNSLDPKIATSFLGASLEEAHLDTNRTLYGIWSTLQTSLTPFLTETLVRCFTRSDFTPETIMLSERPVTLYLRWEETELERLAPLIRVFCISLIKGLLACHDRVQGIGCRPVLLCLDEIGRTPIPDLDGYVSTVRSRNIFIQLYAQSFFQLEKNYGEKEAQTISANMDTHIILRPNDKDTAAGIEEWLGRGSQFAESYNLRKGDALSESLSEQGIPVMSARELQEMHDTHAIILHRNFKPIKALRLKWWQSDMLKKRQGLTPPVLRALPHIPPLPEISLKESEPSGTPEEFINPDTICNRSERRKGIGIER
jgi:type IV secretory pathway TraG/TraD family ATPase VirD4